MRLFELFDKPYQFTKYVSGANKFAYAFESTYTKDGQEAKDIVQAEFHRVKDTNNWHFGFHIGKSGQATGNFDAIRIFATLLEVLKDFLNSPHTRTLENLYFGAELGTGPNAMSRIKLYDRFAKKMPSVGLEYQGDGGIQDGKKYYHFIKP